MKKLAIIILCGAFGMANAQATVANATNTVTATNFLGSGPTSNFDVLFKRNGVNAGKLTTNSVSFGLNSNSIGGVSIGVAAGNSSIGGNNTFLGYWAGGSSNGSNNIAIGGSSGYNHIGDNNICIGSQAGEEGTGTYNIYIGEQAGQGSNEHHKLVIRNDDGPDLIYGDFLSGELMLPNKLGVGFSHHAFSFPLTLAASGSTPAADVSWYRLFVNGGILATEMRILLNGIYGNWPDFVFAKDYKLPSLAEVENQIKEKGHLANVPSAEVVKAQGIEVGEMARIQMAKIEELTLYIIQQNKEIELLKSQMKTLLERK